jgi:alanyl-tRNA synthetase
MNSREIRKAFLSYFSEQGHEIVDSASLVPDNDPTLLFTNSGMVQFKEAFAMKENRGYTRAASCQRCIRAGGKHNDLDNVGYTARHHTFFEMLGNFSFGDYFKEEAIRFAWEFLTEVLVVPRDKLWVTIHTSDDEAEKIWVEKIGFDPARITRLGDEDNFWMMGDTGPCGPCSEIFYDHGETVPGGPPGTEDGDLDRYVEIWNLVFTQYDRDSDGNLTPLPSPCVDTGMGIERIAAVLQHVHNNYDTDLFLPLTKDAARLLGSADSANPSYKVIADHLRSASFLIADGVLPSNEGRGYVMRRIIRRALRHGHKLGSSEPFFHKLVPTLCAVMGDAYPLLTQTAEQIQRVLLKEEQQFELTLDQGMKILDAAMATLNGTVIPGEVIFKLYDTYGFPTDLTGDIARENDLSLDMDGFDRSMQEQRARARAASKFSGQTETELALEIQTNFIGYEVLTGNSQVQALIVNGHEVEKITSGEQALVVLDQTPFYAESGGQTGDRGSFSAENLQVEVQDTVRQGDAHVHLVSVVAGELRKNDKIMAEVGQDARQSTALNHSATHLLHAALRSILGTHVNQRGSLVQSERLRFDFSHFEAVTGSEIRAIERLVNDHIRKNSVISTDIMKVEEAKNTGALALFGEKYSEEVRVLTMGDGFSVELCGGTHAERTGDIGLFRILSEQGVASGVRRIEAVTGEMAMQDMQDLDEASGAVGHMLKVDRSEYAARLKALVDENRKLEKQISQLNAKLASGEGQDVLASAVSIGDTRLLVNQLSGADPKALPDALDRLKNKLGSGVVVLAAADEAKVSLIAGVSKDLTDRVHAGELVNFVASQIGGKGGGRADMARAGGSEVNALPQALASIQGYLEERLRS